MKKITLDVNYSSDENDLAENNERAGSVYTMPKNYIFSDEGINDVPPLLRNLITAHLMEGMCIA